MVNKLAVTTALVVGAMLTGCVSVKNQNGLTPPSALCSKVKGTIGVPKGSVPVGHLKSVRTDASLHLQEWVFSGASAGLIDMSLRNALSNGDLKRVYYADYEQISILGFVTVFNVTAYGE